MRRHFGLIAFVAIFGVATFPWPCASLSAEEGLASSLAIADDGLKRPEADPAFLRRWGVAITVRVSGEFRRQQQITMYEADGIVHAIWIVEGEKTREGETSEGGNLASKQTRISATECPLLADSLSILRKTRFSIEVSRSIHAPSVTYQLWSTSLLETRYLRLHRPDSTASAVSSWGKPPEQDAGLVEFIEKLFKDVTQCTTRP